MMLTLESRRELDDGVPVRLCAEGREVVALRLDVFRTIQAILTTENAVIAAGHTRVPIQPTPLLQPLDIAGFEDVVLLDCGRFEEIKELAEEARVRAVFSDASHESAVRWMKENPY